MWSYMVPLSLIIQRILHINDVTQLVVIFDTVTLQGIMLPDLICLIIRTRHCSWPWAKYNTCLIQNLMFLGTASLFEKQLLCLVITCNVFMPETEVVNVSCNLLGLCSNWVKTMQLIMGKIVYHSCMFDTYFNVFLGAGSLLIYFTFVLLDQTQILSLPK